MKKFVCGFAFDKERRKLLLIRKNRPEFQKGLLNGVGGSIKRGESSYDAMEREFQKETGIKIQAAKWTLFCTLTIPADQSHYGQKSRIFFFGTCTDTIWSAQSITDEQVELNSVQDLPSYSHDVIPNLNWLIPMYLNDPTWYMVEQKQRL